MTTYILHGGRYKVESPDNDYFFKQFTAHVPKEKVTILMCYWARPKTNWGSLFERDKERIAKHTTKKVDVHIVDSADTLRALLPEADVLFVSGGEEELLRPYMSSLGYLKNMLKGKVFIGSSMGTFLASKNYVLSLSTQNENTVYEGLGLIPYNTLCHFNIEKNKEKKIALLKNKDPHTPILCIDEGKFEKIAV